MHTLLSGIPDLSNDDLINLFMQMSQDRGVAYCGIVPFDRIKVVLEDEEHFSGADDAVQQFIESGEFNLNEMYADDVDEQIKSAFENFTPWCYRCRLEGIEGDRKTGDYYRLIKWDGSDHRELDDEINANGEPDEEEEDLVGLVYLTIDDMKKVVAKWDGKIYCDDLREALAWAEAAPNRSFRYYAY